MKNVRFFFLIMLSLGLMTSCVKEDPIIDADDQVAPKLPPMETLLMPFAGFEKADTNDLEGGSNGRSLPTYRNWFHSVSNVVVWNLVVGLNTVIPVASFAEAFNHDPVFQGNGVWLWSYAHTADGATYDVELSARFISDDEVQWDMDIAQRGGFSKVRWYTGVIATDGSRASWTLHHRPENPQPFISIDYLAANEDGEASIRYTNIIPGSADQGDYIEYRENDGASDFNRAYDVYRAATSNLLEIQWHESHENGRVKDAARFGDSEWHCWDTGFADIDC